MHMDYQAIVKETKERMAKAIEVLESEYRGMRTGRASPGLVEGIRAEYYGSPTPLKQLANISAPEPALLVIKPFDPAALPEIQKAIHRSDIGIVPVVDGKIIRLGIPPLSEERRKQLVQRTKQISEEARISIRNIRRDENRKADELEKGSELSEDEAARLKKEILDLTQEFTGRVDKLFEEKSKELMEM